MALGRVLRLAPRDVFTNLALEERLFRLGACPGVMFYVNGPCAVLGRTQNPLVEVDVSGARARGVSIARRRSGGGCVVHDAGNLNFCFVVPRAAHCATAHARLVASVLRDRFAVPATTNRRGDILAADGRKMGGAAYRIAGDRAFHHGTLLVRSDLGALRATLRAPLRHSLAALGTKSVPMPVANVADFAPAVAVDDVVRAIADRYAGAAHPVRVVDLHDVEGAVGGVAAERDVLASHGWVYGQIPRFSYERAGADGLVLAAHMAKGALVKSVQVTAGDGACDGGARLSFLNKLAAQLQGCLFDGSVLAKRLDGLSPQFAGTANEPIAEAFISRLRNEIPRHHWQQH